MQIGIKVIPKARANCILGMEQDAAGEQWLKVRLTVAPEGGKANAALLKLLAKHWNCRVCDLAIVSGHQSRYKRLTVSEHVTIQENNAPADHDD